MDKEFTLKIPEDLARDADEFGLLDSQAILVMLQTEVDRRVQEMVNEEIHTHRTEKGNSEVLSV